MPDPTFDGKIRPVTASNVLAAVGDDLLQIKMQDGLRWSDIGEVLGVGDDQAAKYADGSAAMNIVAYAKGKQVWNGRFTGSLDKLVEQAAPHVSGQRAQSCIAKAQWALSVALEDGQLTDDEIRKSRADLERCRDAINGLLNRLTVRVA